MSMSVRYWGEFRSIRGDLYRVEILREDNGITTPSEQIGFAHDEPAEIEWSEVDKLEPVQGSSLTLTLDSDTDRKFLDLYTIDVDTIRADVYRQGVLYWSGMLDPELYEEPYSYKQDYDVSISFSDFAILDRKPWTGREILSIRAVIDKCLAATGINYEGLVSHISTRLSAATAPLTLDEVYVTAENFYDEDDEPMTLREALEAVLQPYALQISQKNGHIYLRDLNALHALDAQPIVWSDTDANLEADIVYNNVKVTYSPYVGKILLDGTLDYDTVLKDQPIGTSGELVRVDDRSSSPEGFRIVRDTASGKTVGNLTLSGGAVVCRIDPEYSGNDEAAVLWGYKIYGNDNGSGWRGQEPSIAYPVTAPSLHNRIIKTKRCYLGIVPNPDKWRLKISLEVLLDVRYNPFESDGEHNQEGNYDRLKNWCNYGYLPVGINMFDAAGNYLCCYHNYRRLLDDWYGDNGTWDTSTTTLYKYPNEYSRCWLSYYDASNRKSSTGFGGWATNKQLIGRHSDGLPLVMRKLDNGAYINLPPTNGYIELSVFEGILTYDNDDSDPNRNILSRLRWLAYKNPKIEIVKANGLDIDQEDVEDTAWINKSAKEDLTIDTVFGTMPEAVPSARGLLMTADGTVISKFSRGGHTDRLERLLIGTAYSQYATRKHVLSGTVELLPTFGVVTDVSEPGQYVLLSEVQHLMRDESEIKMVQFDADNYDAIEDKED